MEAKGRRVWGRLYAGTRNHRNVRRLRERCPGSWTYWYVLIEMAIECDAGGWIHLSPGLPFSDKELRNELGIARVSTMNQLISELISLKMVSKDVNGLFLKSFSDRNYLSDNSTSRVQKHREKKNMEYGQAGDSKQGGNVSITPPEHSRAQQIIEHTKADIPPTPQGEDFEGLRSTMAPADPACSECRGSGMVEITKNGTAFQMFCSCRRPKRDNPPLNDHQED